MTRMIGRYDWTRIWRIRGLFVIISHMSLQMQGVYHDKLSDWLYGVILRRVEEYVGCVLFTCPCHTQGLHHAKLTPLNVFTAAHPRRVNFVANWTSHHVLGHLELFLLSTPMVRSKRCKSRESFFCEFIGDIQGWAPAGSSQNPGWLARPAAKSPLKSFFELTLITQAIVVMWGVFALMLANRYSPVAINQNALDSLTHTIGPLIIESLWAKK